MSLMSTESPIDFHVNKCNIAHAKEELMHPIITLKIYNFLLTGLSYDLSLQMLSIKKKYYRVAEIQHMVKYFYLNGYIQYLT